MSVPAFKVTIRIEADSVFAVPSLLASMSSLDFLTAMSGLGSIEPINEEAAEAIERAKELLS